MTTIHRLCICGCGRVVADPRAAKCGVCLCRELNALIDEVRAKRLARS